MIHVCYAMRDESGRYSKFVGTSMLSMLENTREKITVHLIHDSTLSHENRKKFLQIVYKYDQEIEFYNVEELVPNKLKEIENALPDAKKYFATVATMYRIFIPEFLSPDITKAIYLDGDTIINIDINELWQINLGNYPIAAANEFPAYSTQEAMNDLVPLCANGRIDFKKYFNSGVLVLNLDNTNIRGGYILFNSCLKIADKEYVHYLEQDMLNILFSNNYLKLPTNFNQALHAIKTYNPTFKIDWHGIIHYTNSTINPQINDDLDRLWFEYFIKTPFCTPETFKNLCAGIESRMQLKFDILQKIFEIKTSKQKRIGLCVEPKNAEIATKFFETNELILNANDSDITQNVLEHMKQNVVFIIAAKTQLFMSIRDRLTAEGFIENRDFFNGFYFFIPKAFTYTRVIRQM